MPISTCLGLCKIEAVVVGFSLKKPFCVALQGTQKAKLGTLPQAQGSSQAIHREN